jgi:hypothetical protein
VSVRKKRLILLAGVALGALGGLVAYTQQSKPLDPFEEAMRQREMYLETFGILPGDLIVVDKSLSPRAGTIVVAEVGGEFTVKHLERDAAGAWSLRADSPRWPGWSLPFTPECRIWGTVVAVVRRC